MDYDTSESFTNNGAELVRMFHSDTFKNTTNSDSFDKIILSLLVVLLLNVSLW